MIMGLILGFMFTGITVLAYWYGIVPDEKATVVSQIAESTFTVADCTFSFKGLQQ